MFQSYLWLMGGIELGLDILEKQERAINKFLYNLDDNLVHNLLPNVIDNDLAAENAYKMHYEGKIKL